MMLEKVYKTIVFVVTKYEPIPSLLVRAVRCNYLLSEIECALVLARQ